VTGGEVHPGTAGHDAAEVVTEGVGAARLARGAADARRGRIARGYCGAYRPVASRPGTAA
jgi:hypothetical protein